MSQLDSWHTSGVRIDRPAVALADAGDAALASAAALGDRAAFEVVVHRYGPMLYRYARRMLTNEHDVADAVQETFVAAWRQLGTFRASSSLKTWLFSICARKIVDTYRVKSASPSTTLPCRHIRPPDPTRSRRRPRRNSWPRWSWRSTNSHRASAHRGYSRRSRR